MFDKLVISLISPLGTALFLGVMSLLLIRFKKIRFASVVLTLSLLWLFVFSMPVVSNALRASVEAQFPPIQMGALSKKAQAIVVLGGGTQSAEVSGQMPDLNSGADRMWHAARLYHAGLAPILVLSGGGNLDVSLNSEAEDMRTFLSDLGVPTDAMVLEGLSRNSRQNAQFTADILRPQGINQIILVTSALHMRRAVASFENQGFTVIPAATDYEARTRFDWTGFLPDASALNGSARAIKEIVGRISGR
jgi:uncharacterized SAM-binding protein YcdF (DUF218 family)